MDFKVLKKLNLVDYPEVLEKLKKCQGIKEVWDVLHTFENSLDKVIAELEKNVDPQELLDELHRYNDMKDMTQSVIGTLANIQGNTIAKVHEQFNVISD
nr:DNA repair protein SWI5 homolog [Halyomorpha halys]